MRKLALIIFIFMLVGCAAPITSPNYYMGDDSGYALVSITAEKFIGKFEVYIEPEEENPGYQLRQDYDNGYKSRRKPDYREGEASGKVRLQRLKPGKYTIKKIAIFAGPPKVIQNLKIDFEVKPGEISYLGEFYFNDERRFLVRDVSLTIKNRLNRDQIIMYEKYDWIKKIRINKTSSRWL